MESCELKIKLLAILYRVLSISEPYFENHWCWRLTWGLQLGIWCQKDVLVVRMDTLFQCNLALRIYVPRDIRDLKSVITPSYNQPINDCNMVLYWPETQRSFWTTGLHDYARFRLLIWWWENSRGQHRILKAFSDAWHADGYVIDEKELAKYISQTLNLTPDLFVGGWALGPIGLWGRRISKAHYFYTPSSLPQFRPKPWWWSKWKGISPEIKPPEDKVIDVKMLYVYQRVFHICLRM